MSNRLKRDTNPREPQNGIYIRNISADDDFRLRIPKSIVAELRLQETRKLALHINEHGQLVVEPVTQSREGQQ